MKVFLCFSFPQFCVDAFPYCVPIKLCLCDIWVLKLFAVDGHSDSADHHQALCHISQRLQSETKFVELLSYTGLLQTLPMLHIPTKFHENWPGSIFLRTDRGNADACICAATMWRLLVWHVFCKPTMEEMWALGSILFMMMTSYKRAKTWRMDQLDRHSQSFGDYFSSPRHPLLQASCSESD